MTTNQDAAVTTGQMVTVYAHFTTLLEAKERHFNDLITGVKDTAALQHAATERAVEIASEALTERLNAANEIRAALDDMSRLMARRAELETAILALRAELKASLGSLEADVRSLREDRASYAIKAEVRTLEDGTERELRSLREFRTVIEAKASQEDVKRVARTADFGRMLAIIGTAVSVISLVVSLAARLLGS